MIAFIVLCCVACFILGELGVGSRLLSLVLRLWQPEVNLDGANLRDACGEGCKIRNGHHA